MTHFSIPDFSTVFVLVAGDVMLDRYIWGSVDRISPEAPVPVLLVRERTRRLGGAGNVAANLASLGCRTVLAGILGRDPAGENVARLLESRSIKDRCVRSDNIPTVTKSRVMAGGQQVVRMDDEKPEKIDKKTRDTVIEVLSGDLRDAGAVILSDYGKGFFEGNTAARCIRKCRENGIPVFVDPKRSDWSVYAGATCITPNLREFSEACDRIGCDPTRMEPSAATLLHRYDLDFLLVTRGSRGMILVGKKGVSASVPATAKEVFDVSGAGDTVIALMAAGAAAGMEMAEAMEMANIGAGEVVSRVGTYALSRRELQQAASRSLFDSGLPAACSLEQANAMVEHWRMRGKIVVFTNGCFDILHPGHVFLLHRARALGDCLVVGLNTDASIRRIKGPDRPILGQEDRAAILAALSSVDLVVCFDEDTPVELIRKLRPDILVKGSDYTPDTVVGGDIVQSWGGRVALVDLLEAKSTTGIVEKIREKQDDNST